MSRLLTYADYQRELRALRELLAHEEVLQIEEPAVAGEIAKASLNARIRMLEEEIRQLTDDQLPGVELDIILSGESVVGNRVDSEVMGKVLLEMQHMVSSIVAESSDEHAQAGPFSASVKRASTLRFAESFSGSFGMRLEAVQDQVELDGFFTLAPSMHTLVDLVSSSDREQLLTSLATAGERAAKHFTSLLSTLSSSNTALKVIWPTTGGRREAFLGVARVKEVHALLREISVEEQGHYYYGELDSANKRKGRFGFTAQTGEVFDGVVEEHLVEELKRYFDRVCRAYIVTRVVRHVSSGVEISQYRLQELAEPDAPLFADEA